MARFGAETNIPPWARRLHVLLVDEDLFSLTNMKRVLDNNSYRVTPEDSTVSALSMILKKGSKYDIVMTEIAMPQLDGFKFLEQIRVRCSSDIPVIILMTANVQPGMQQKAFNLGANWFFKKPVAEHDLAGIWHYAIRKRFGASQPNVQTGRIPYLLNSDILNSSSSTQTEPTARSIHDNYNYGNQGTTTNTGGRERTRSRMFWTQELQSKFNFALTQLGQTRSKPQEILKLMNHPDLTLRQVANHLQKCRNKAKKTGVPMHLLMPQQNILPNVSSIPQLNDPNLSNGTGEGNNDGMNSLVLPTQSLEPQWQKDSSNNTGNNQSTFQVTPYVDSSASVPILSADQLLKLLDSPSSSNMGGLNTCNFGSVGNNFSFGNDEQSQMLFDSMELPEDFAIDWEALALEVGIMNDEQSQKLFDSQEAQEDFDIDWESLTQEADIMNESGSFMPKPGELRTWCLDDLTALLDDNTNI